MGYIGDIDDDNIDNEDNSKKKCRFKFELQGEKQIYVFGVNPSYAQGMIRERSAWVHEYVEDLNCPQRFKGINNDYVLDKTIERVEFFIRKAGYDGFVMLNVCAQRTSNPEELMPDEKLHNKNKQKIEEYLNGKKDIDVLLAFGNPIGSTKSWQFGYLKEIIGEIRKKHETTFYVLDDPTKSCLTSNKNPRHPSPKHPSKPLSDDTRLLEFDFNNPNNRLYMYKKCRKWNFLK